MSYRLLSAAIIAGVTLSSASVLAGPLDKAKDAVDPDCTFGKAAKGAAMKATVGVGNRCDAAETARDVTGTDGKLEDAQDKADGALKKIGN